jgi:hypothetical protein
VTWVWSRWPATVVVIVMTCAACVQQDGAGSSGSNGDRESPILETPPSEADPRPFREVSSDSPGGPVHREPLPASPGSVEVERAAVVGKRRVDAERFAILLSHALVDQTDGSAGDAFRDYLADSTPQEAVSGIEWHRAWPGMHVVSGSRSWLRSVRVDGANSYAVYVVLKVSVPRSSAAGDEYVSWTGNRLAVAFLDDQWRLVDYQQTGVSESEEFSEWTWEGSMNSGRGWRRVSVG